MAEFSENDVQYAEQIVAQLMRDDEKTLELENDVVVYDLELDAERFSSELELFNAYGSNVPAMRVAGEEFVPVSIRNFYESGYRSSIPFPSNRRPRREWWRDEEFFVKDWIDSGRLERGVQYEGIYAISPGEARVAFTKQAVNFLATRIAAVKSFRERGNAERRVKSALLSLRQKVGGVQITTPGCHFTVSTNSSGLRVFWSGAYYVSPNYFSHPTSPATSVLQAGTYMFGVDGGAYGSTIQWDTSLVVSLPGTPFAHLNY